MMTRPHRIFSCLVALCLAAPALADDGQLYQDPADPNATFVRVVSPGETLAVVESRTFDNVKGGVTPYVMVTSNRVSVAVGDLESNADIAPASFYTFIVGAEGSIAMVKDEITNSPAKADLVFYNLSDLPTVDLFVPKANAIAREAIAPGTSRQVTLKAPLILDFEVRNGDATLAVLPEVEMRRRAGVTVVFSGTAGSYSAYSTENLYSN